MELIHIGLMRKRVAVDEIEAAARYPERDAVCLECGCRHQRGTKVGRRLRGEMRGQNDAKPKGRQARIAITQSVFGRGLSLPDGHDAEHLGQILDDHLGAQLVEIEPIDAGFGERFGDIQEEAAAVLSGRLGNDHIHDDLALRRQQRRKNGAVRRHPADVGGQQAIEKTPHIIAGDLDDAAVWKQRCFHGFLPIPTLSSPASREGRVG